MKNKWKLIADFPVKKYACGLVAGQRVRLRKNFQVKDPGGKVVGPIHKAGEIWEVLKGSDEPPIVVWLRRPDDEQHTWEDSISIFDTFEIVRSGVEPAEQ
jgi:hypothetical protein